MTEDEVVGWHHQLYGHEFEQNLEASSRRWWWTGNSGMLQPMGSQSQTQLSDWTELNWMMSLYQFSSITQLCSNFWDPMDCSMPGLPVHHQLWSLLKLMSIELVRPSNHLILCHPLLFPPSVFPASGSFQMSQFLTSGGQSNGASASVSILPMNIQDWFPLRLTSLTGFNFNG